MPPSPLTPITNTPYLVGEALLHAPIDDALVLITLPIFPILQNMEPLIIRGGAFQTFLTFQPPLLSLQGQTSNQNSSQSIVSRQDMLYGLQ